MRPAGAAVETLLRLRARAEEAARLQALRSADRLRLATEAVSAADARWADLATGPQGGAALGAASRLAGWLRSDRDRRQEESDRARSAHRAARAARRGAQLLAERRRDAEDRRRRRRAEEEADDRVAACRGPAGSSG